MSHQYIKPFRDYYLPLRASGAAWLCVHIVCVCSSQGAVSQLSGWLMEIAPDKCCPTNHIQGKTMLRSVIIVKECNNPGAVLSCTSDCALPLFYVVG